MASQVFVDSVMKEIILPGVDQLVALPYFTELRAGKLSKKGCKAGRCNTICTTSRCSKALPFAWSRTVTTPTYSNIFFIR